MQPLTVITGILLASSAAITFCTLVVAFLLYLYADDYSYVDAEFPVFLLSATLFSLLTAVCAVSFIGLLRNKAWRWWAQLAMWLAIALIGLYYWPE